MRRGCKESEGHDRGAESIERHMAAGFIIVRQRAGEDLILRAALSLSVTRSPSSPIGPALSQWADNGKEAY